jgi:hypothetical protein
MHSLNRLARRSLTGLAVAGVAFMTSCGTDDGLGKRFPVSGKVTYNGSPLEKGSISFIPEDAKSGVGATGAIANGLYTLATGGGNDGARAGKYKVTITAKEDTTAKAKADFEKARAARRDSGATETLAVIPRQFAAKAEATAKSLIPAGYGNPSTTNLTAEVKEESNSIDFPLSDADAPPEPPKTPTKRPGAKGS